MSNENWATFWQFTIWVGAILVASGALAYYIVSERIKKDEERAKATSGVIGSIISDRRKKLINKRTSFTVKFGSNSWEVGVYESTEKPVQFNLFGNTPLVQSLFGFSKFEPVFFKYHNNKVYVSAKVYGIDGKIICEIVDNEWTVNPNNIYQKNFNDKAVEVLDQYGNVALSVELESDNTIDLQGIFFSQEGDCAVLYENGFNILRYVGRSAKSNLPELSLSQYNKAGKLIPRKFVYTGNDFLGKRVRK